MGKQRTRTSLLISSNIDRRLSYVRITVFSLLLLMCAGVVHAAAQQSSEPSPEQESDSPISVIESFSDKEQGASEVTEISDKQKHTILFIMGLALLIAVIVTASLGLAMAMHGKQVFVAHMIGAGITVFLSIAHAVVAVVWFFPF